MPAMAMPPTWPGWSRARALRRISRCSTNPPAPTGHSSDQPSPSTRRMTAISVPAASACDLETGTSPSPGLMSIKTASFGIARASRTAATALYASAARPTCRLARSCDQYMKAPATWRAISLRLMPTSLHGGSEEGRDVVCAPQTHPEARSPAPARSKRRQRRVPPRRHRPKLPQDGQTDHDVASASPRLKGQGIDRSRRARQELAPITDFFNRIRPKDGRLVLAITSLKADIRTLPY